MLALVPTYGHLLLFLFKTNKISRSPAAHIIYPSCVVQQEDHKIHIIIDIGVYSQQHQHTSTIANSTISSTSVVRHVRLVHDMICSLSAITKQPPLSCSFPFPPTTNQCVRIMFAVRVTCNCVDCFLCVSDILLRCVCKHITPYSLLFCSSSFLLFLCERTEHLE